MQATMSGSQRRAGFLSRERRLTILGVLIVACMVSTTAHYTHNYLEVAHYPKSWWIGDSTVRLGIVIAWPALTTLGVLGFWLYARQRYVAAYPFLALYSVLGIVTLGHFTPGSPHIPSFWYSTIFTDALLGFAILAFAHWSAVMAGRPADGSGAPLV